MKTDFELCMEVQEGNEKSEIELWERYQTQIRIHARKLFRSFHSRSVSLDVDDFCSEAWFKFHDRVMTVHSDPEYWIPGSQQTWKFTSLFWYDLMKLRNEFYKKLFSDGSITSLEAEISRANESLDSPDSTDIKFHGETFLSRYSAEVMNFDYEDLEEKREQIELVFSPFQQQIIDMKFEGMSFKAIAFSLEETYITVLREYHKAKNIAKCILAIA